MLRRRWGCGLWRIRPRFANRRESSKNKKKMHITKRDLICFMRLCVDSLPTQIRNSYWLFWCARQIFELPDSLFRFRNKYDSGEVRNLAIFYEGTSKNCLPHVSGNTDINSHHIRLIKSLYLKHMPASIIDVGCGSGYMMEYLQQVDQECRMIGIDYNIPKKELLMNGKNTYLNTEIGKYISDLPSKSHDFVLCTHVLEHIERPENALRELRRICSRKLIIICPLEKKFKWGMNYHITFFPKISLFLKFLHQDFIKENTTIPKHIVSEYLGDAIYTETI